MNTRTGNSAQGYLTLTFPCQSPAAPSALRKKIATIVPCLFAIVVAAGCATTKVTSQQQLVTGQLPRPNTVWVYDFAATPADVPANAAIAGQYSTTTPQTAEQIAMGRQLGAQIAAELVQQIQSMGMPAARGGAGTIPQINDIVLRGYLLSVHRQCGRAPRHRIRLRGVRVENGVEGYQITPQGPRELGSGTVDSGGSKAPGRPWGLPASSTGNPAGLIISTGMKVYGEKSGSSTIEGRAQQTAKEIAEVLKRRAQQQGWIQ
jgi:hypothetical protein